MAEGDISTTRSIRANGVDFGLIEAGAGPLALCLHGFPDSAHTWRHLLPALAGSGFHAVAPFMRGYAPTTIPPDGCYMVGALVSDAVALHAALGGDDRAVLIGHDWGAEAAYGAAAFAPDRWRRVVTLSVPPFALDERIFSDYDQLKRFFYLFFLQRPDAERVVAKDDMAFLDRLWRDWSPAYDAREDLARVKACLRNPDNLAAAIGYYRAYDPLFAEPAREGEYDREQAALSNVGPQPTLYIHGEADGGIAAALVTDSERHLAPGSSMRLVAGVGHFPHLEKPDELNEAIVGWITS